MPPCRTSPPDVACIASGLPDANAAMVGPAAKRDLAVIVRGAESAVLGGLAGYTGWGWLDVEKIWLDETVRGRGLTRRLPAQAEAEALARFCHGAWLDTFNPEVPRIREGLGYVAIGALPDFPLGRARVFLMKSCNPDWMRSRMIKPDDFRRLALSMPDAVESAHMGHPDFRVGKRIFATLDHPEPGYAMVKLTVEQRNIVIEEAPGAFAPVKGGWGKDGATTVALAHASEESTESAIRMAWENLERRSLSRR